MPVPPESVQIGKCYLLAATGNFPRIRRVTQILSSGLVEYEQRTLKTNWRKRIQYRDVFAAMVLREVPCDWTPEGDE